MAEDLRDSIWKSAYLLWYNAKYNTELASRMVDKLKAIDDVTKVLVAITASGSAVAGWSLWSEKGLEYIWAILAGMAALISIIHGSLGIPARLKDWLESKKDFLVLRADVNALRSSMANHPDFDASKAEETLAALTKKFAEFEGRIPSDFFATSRLKATCQNNVDEDIAGRRAIMEEGKEISNGH